MNKKEKMDEEHFAVIISFIVAGVAAFIGFINEINLSLNFLIFIIVFMFSFIFVLIGKSAYDSFKEQGKNKK